jgi:hypothetical protein
LTAEESISMKETRSSVESGLREERKSEGGSVGRARRPEKKGLLGQARFKTVKVGKAIRKERYRA